jgi:hypothetical protein
MDFVIFCKTLWDFCTLNTAGIARYVWDFIIFAYLSSKFIYRYVFEIFDLDNEHLLEAPDIETMYKMLYDSDDCDTKHLQAFKYDANGQISKDKFIKHCRNKKFLIKPALEYQSRVRKAVGGVLLWEALSAYRRRHFSVYDAKVLCPNSC